MEQDRPKEGQPSLEELEQERRRLQEELGKIDPYNYNNKNADINNRPWDYDKIIPIPHPEKYNPEATWRIKATPRPSQTEGQPPKSLEEILAPLDSVFIDDSLKDEIVTRVAIPDILERKEPAYSGVILFGPPGTGKTVLLNAIADVYRLAGAYTKEINLAQINVAWVGQFAANLERELQEALNEAKTRGKPSFVYIDEGTILAQAASEGAASVSKHYQEAMDVLKKYIGNYRELVFAISTNALPDSFEQALTREGRLTSYFIGHPDETQRARMWKHFSDKYGVLDLTDEQSQELALIIPNEQGAFIEEFCRNYMRARRSSVLKERGYNTLVDALKQRANVRDEEVKATITYDTLREDLVQTLTAKYQRQQEAQEANGGKRIGFASSQ